MCAAAARSCGSPQHLLISSDCLWGITPTNSRLVPGNVQPLCAALVQLSLASICRVALRCTCCALAASVHCSGRVFIAPIRRSGVAAALAASGGTPRTADGRLIVGFEPAASEPPSKRHGVGGANPLDGRQTAAPVAERACAGPVVDGSPILTASWPAAASAAAATAARLSPGSVGGGSSLAPHAAAGLVLPLSPTLERPLPTAPGSAVSGRKSDDGAICAHQPVVGAAALGVSTGADSGGDAALTHPVPISVSTGASGRPVHRMVMSPDRPHIQASEDDVIGFNADGGRIFTARSVVVCGSCGMPVVGSGRGGANGGVAASARAHTAHAVAALAKSRALKDAPPHVMLCDGQTFASLRVCRSACCRCYMHACCRCFMRACCRCCMHACCRCCMHACCRCCMHACCRHLVL